jgi:glycosyltransferase involved in cell wall biosynthesis
LSHALHFIVPGDPAQRTGGYLFDARIVNELRALGWTVEVTGLEGRFPLADETARGSMRATLAALADQSLVVIDGLALGAVPDAIAEQARRLKLVALVHHPLADETGLDEDQQAHLLAGERQALAYCQAVLVTSAFTARRLQALGLTRQMPMVIEPGVDRSEPAPAARARRETGTEPDSENLLCVASLTPRKGQDLLLSALADLCHLPWRCCLSGSDQRAPAFAAALRHQVARLDLAARVEMPGERDPAELEADYRWASVCVLPSHYEGYGMVVTEALARGLPVISTTGGALADTVPEETGLRVPPGNREALAKALHTWLTDRALRQRCTRAALARRERLPTWRDSAHRFAQALQST